MQAGHHLPGDFGNRGLLRAFRLFISSAQTDESFLDLDPLGLRQRELGFLGEILSDGMSADVDAAGINISLFEKQQVARFGANIQQHGASFQIAIIKAKGVAQGRRRNISQLQTQSGCLGDTEQSFHNVGLDGDQKNFQLASGRGA